MKKIKAVAIILFLIISVSCTASAFDISAVGGCSMDFATGEVFYAKNADTLMTPASMTKVMTLYIIFEEISAGNMSFDTLVPISENAAKEAARPGYTNIPLKSGTSVKLDTLISGITTVSACGACVAVAEFIAGSEAQFVVLMNEKVKELGLTADFKDSSGISNYNAITPRSLAKLVRTFISRHPQILNYTKKKTVTINGVTYTSTNRLLSNGKNGRYYQGADGFKTGTTNKAGKCIVSTAYRDGERVISVVMNAPTNTARYTDSIKLLDDGFAQAKDKKSRYLYTTDIKAYINDYEIPCCYYLGGKGSLCIIAENLNSFGFDTNYEASTSTLYISYNPGKEVYTMVPGDVEPMTPAYKINKQTSLKVILLKDGAEYPLETTFSLNGMCAVSIDELGRYFSYAWDSATRKAFLYAG